MTPAALRIRPATESDLHALAAVERSAAVLFRGIGLDWIAESPAMDLAVLDLCRAAGTLWIAPDHDDRPTGFLAATDLDGAFFILELSVAAEHQGRGLGRALLHAALDQARWRYYGAAALTTYRDVPWNAPFYARHGFVALREFDLSPGLKAKLADEARHGHDPDRRVAMAKVL